MTDGALADRALEPTVKTLQEDVARLRAAFGRFEAHEVSAVDPHSRCYERFRSQLEHEDDLVGQRLGWLITSQAVLFGFFGTAANATTPRINLTPIPVVGLVVSVLVGLTIYTGLLALLNIRTCFEQCHGGLAASGHGYDLIPQSSPLPFMGLAAPIVMPVLFVVGWVYFLLAGPI